MPSIATASRGKKDGERRVLRWRRGA